MGGRPAPPREDRLGDSRWTPLGLPALFLLPGPAAAAGAAVLAPTPLRLCAGTFPPPDRLAFGGMSIGQTVGCDNRVARTRATATCVGRQMDKAMKRARAQALVDCAERKLRERIQNQYRATNAQRRGDFAKSLGLLSGGGWFNVVEEMEGRPV